MAGQTSPGEVYAAGKEKAMTENKLYCDICQKQIYRNHLWYKLRRRMFEYDIFGEKRQLDICEDCYCLIVEMARSKEATP